MTGFKLHHPPGFVDRAYLVFWLLSLLTELPVDDGPESLSPPFRVRVWTPACRRMTSPVAPRRRETHRSRGPGEKLGRLRAALGLRSPQPPPRASDPVPPEEPAP